MENQLNEYKVGHKVFLKKLRKTGVITNIDYDNNIIEANYYNQGNVQGDKFDIGDVGEYKKIPTVLFAKVRPGAKPLIKKNEDAGYDLYACFEGENVIIKQGEIKPIPTGIAVSMLPDFCIKVCERGSSGINGLAVRAGVVDSGYRDEIFVVINNTSDRDIEITKTIDRVEDYTDYIKYPYSKAIAQAKVELVPNVQVKEINYEGLKKIPSERGMGKFGSTDNQ